MGSCWLYGDRLRTERLEEAEVSLPLDEGRRLCFEEERSGEEGGTGDRRMGLRVGGGSILEQALSKAVNDIVVAQSGFQYCPPSHMLIASAEGHHP